MTTTFYSLKCEKCHAEFVHKNPEARHCIDCIRKWLNMKPNPDKADYGARKIVYWWKRLRSMGVSDREIFERIADGLGEDFKPKVMRPADAIDVTEK